MSRNYQSLARTHIISIPLLFLFSVHATIEAISMHIMSLNTLIAVVGVGKRKSFHLNTNKLSKIIRRDNSVFDNYRHDNFRAIIAVRYHR
jgi:hypothetical protein